MTSESGFNESGTLLRKVNWFNDVNNVTNDQECLQGITFGSGVDNIVLRKPVVMKGNSGIESEFVIGSADHRVTLSMDENIDFKDGYSVAEESYKDAGEIVLENGENLGKCLIYIRTNVLKLLNLTIKGGNTIMANGVCVNANTVVFENVVIESFAGDVDPATDDPNGYGILVSSAGTVKFNGFNSIGPGVKSGLKMLGNTDSYQQRIDVSGVFDMDDSTKSLDFIGSQETPFIVPSAAQIDPNSLCVSYNSTAKQYSVIGNTTCENCDETQQIKKLYVFVVPKITIDITKRGKSPLAKPVYVHDVGGAGYIGYFNFTFGFTNDAAAGNIFMIPETTPGIYATSTNIIPLQLNTACAEIGRAHV